MGNEILVKVESVSKKFCRSLRRSLWYGVQDMGAELLGIPRNPVLRKDEFWAVADVSFELRRGECLGLIGHNGAGKSTLLKMLNGLIKPDKGRITIKGRVGALIELGTGFNPVLTGRENIYNNGAVLGFTKKEIDQMFDEIVEFAEIGDFLDTPVQNYSSGMKVRLGFAVAAQMKPDVLLIDEVLAVGDISFVLKCFNRIDVLLRDTCVIFVSHSIPQVARMCTHLLLLSHGQTKYYGSDVSEGINFYYSMQEMPTGNYFGSEVASLEHVQLSSGGRMSQPGELFSLEYGNELFVTIRIRLNQPLEMARIYLAFYDSTQRNFGEVLNFQDFIPGLESKTGTWVFEARFPAIEFAQGIYSITVGMSDLSKNSRRNIFRKQSAVYFSVKGKYHGWAPMQFRPDWRILDVIAE